MENFDEETIERLSKIFIEDTELYEFEPDLCDILREKRIVNLSQLFNDDSVNKKLAHINSDIRGQIKFLISILKNKYLGEPLPFSEYLSKKIDLKTSPLREYCRYFSFEDGEKVYLEDMFVFTKPLIRAYWEYTRFVSKNKDIYPDGKAPFIDYLRTLLNSYGLCDKRNKKDKGYIIVQAYVNAYDKDNIDDSKLQANYKNQLLFLRNQLEYCKKMRDDFDEQVFNLENQIKELSYTIKTPKRKVSKVL